MTAERIERALDALAEFMVEEGPAGCVYLPIYQRLERELSSVRALSEAMDAVFERARRLAAALSK